MALKKIPIFQGLPDNLLKDLAGIAVEQNFGPGEIVFSEGDEAIGFYVVADGRIKIFKLGVDGKEQILHIFSQGEPFGEVAVFTGRRFPAYAQAMEKLTTLLFPRAALLESMRRNPDLSLNIIGVLSMRLRNFTNLIEDLSLKEVPGRLARYLLYLSDSQNETARLRLNITKSQLASLLGTIPETLSRILAKLSQGRFDRSGRPAYHHRRPGRTGAAVRPQNFR